MIILDRMLLGGIRFVLNRIADAVDAELSSEDAVREELLAAQMQLELGEIDEASFAALEKALLARMRELRKQRGAMEAQPGELKVTGVEASVLQGHSIDQHDRGE
ncbi:MAG TPA: gas vesicle protein GvpG [Polyangia bacterium]|nr:gas vesicle protein GvpG [Polyangia bacterium]